MQGRCGARRGVLLSSTSSSSPSLSQSSSSSALAGSVRSVVMPTDAADGMGPRVEVSPRFFPKYQASSSASHDFFILYACAGFIILPHSHVHLTYSLFTLCVLLRPLLLDRSRFCVAVESCTSHKWN